MPRPTARRPLTDREREVLTFLLDFDPGASMREAHRALVAQADFLRVTDRCDCGCASVMFDVDRDRAPRASGYDGHLLVSEAQHISESRQVMLFVEDGWLNQIEIVDYDEVHAPELPAPSALRLATESDWRLVLHKGLIGRSWASAARGARLRHRRLVGCRDHVAGPCQAGDPFLGRGVPVREFLGYRVGGEDWTVAKLAGGPCADLAVALQTRPVDFSCDDKEQAEFRSAPQGHGEGIAQGAVGDGQTLGNGCR